ncbi:methyltransferase [Bacillus luteolus]|uniref:Methyltransferase n=1 Tax=Litchfieldia luteola TaxID=682179 RepID=A0ABR9QQB7_9BACI|nr:methyltransferase [Cytobacillus luteolus]MBE4910677.1 methyltransferase [Cytobacillus luteolus]MBP1943856.1 SAM-dependent methyltransferase [Cytobacillus luteolus]
MKEHYYEKLLNIRTRDNQKKSNQSIHYHPYEPTPYEALEQLIERYDVNKSDQIVDFGCGKGRLLFFLHYTSGAVVKGVEMNSTFYEEASANLKNYSKRHRTLSTKAISLIHNSYAEEYEIEPTDNRFYFFNPFSIKVFMKVISNILVSMEKSPREVEIVLYYPSEDYIYYLENQTSFELKNEIQVEGYYQQNQNERFLVYRGLTPGALK